MSAIIKVKDLKKHFSTPQGMLHAVDGLTFDIEAGETLGVVGESGCGKSTLGRTILHLLDITDGTVEFKGRDITNINKKEFIELRKEMQMIFQDPFSSVNPRMTVSEIIKEPIIIHKLAKNKEEASRKVDELMDTVGLASRLSNSYPHELDGGRRQRIGIARALAFNPIFIVADEPVSALDVSIQAQVLNLMQDLQDELDLTYLFITHDLSVVKHISDDILVMYLGLMVEKSDSQELFKTPLHPYTKALLSAIPTPSLDDKRERILLKGEISSPIEPKPGCRFAPRCPYAQDECRSVDPVMEEIKPGHFTACHYTREINNL